MRHRELSLTGLTSFAHLSNIESLDISRNDIDSLRRESSNLTDLSSYLIYDLRAGVATTFTRIESRL